MFYWNMNKVNEKSPTNDLGDLLSIYYIYAIFQARRNFFYARDYNEIRLSSMQLVLKVYNAVNFFLVWETNLFQTKVIVCAFCAKKDVLFTIQKGQTVVKENPICALRVIGSIVLWKEEYYTLHKLQFY